MPVEIPHPTGKKDSPGLEYYISGLNAVIEEEYKHGINLLSRAVELDSDIPDAYYHLGKLFVRQGDVIRAQKLFRDLLLRRDLPREFRKKVETALIKAYIANRDFSPAEELARFRVLKFSDDSEMRLILTQIFERQNKYEDAKGHWQAYAKLTKTPPKPRLGLYKVETARNLEGKDKKARRSLLQSAISLDPACAPAYILLARQYRDEGKTKKVMDTWNQLMEKAPELSPLIFDEMEQYYYEQNRYPELLGVYQALCRKPGEHEAAARVALAHQYYKRGNSQEARASILKAQKRNGSPKPALDELIHYCLVLNQRESAALEIQDLFTDFYSRKEFTCRECGAKSKEAEWHCPDCGMWESYSW